MNKITIRLLQDLSVLQFRMCLLRYARNRRDVETVNCTQLGKLEDNKISYKREMRS